MLNPELRRYLEEELYQRMREAERAYCSAATEFRKQMKSWKKRQRDGLDGEYAFQSSRVAERKAEDFYFEALQTFNDFLLYQRVPPPKHLLEPVLKQAMTATGADMGNIQVFDRREEALKIKVHSGFKPPFLNFFANVHDGRGASCGAALKTVQRVTVEDVTESRIFAGTEALQVLLDSGVRACQSTPLVTPGGELVGMLNTHCRKPTRPAMSDFQVIEQLGARAAVFIMVS